MQRKRVYTAIAAILMLPGYWCAAAEKTIVVAADGTGDFKSIQDAIAALPDKSADRITLHIKPGTYTGQILLSKSKSNVTFQGEDITTCILTYDHNVLEPLPKGVTARNRGIGVVILGDSFHADHLTFQNTSGDHGQALALRIDGDRAVVEHCRLTGWQDTLRVDNGRSYFAHCYIEGRVDFIYGSGTAVFDNCEIHSKNGGFVTAASTPQDHPYGFVFLHCKLTGDATPWKSATASTHPAQVTPLAELGRPWRPFASVTYLHCDLGNHIDPAGWNNWGKVDNEKTARYAEYQSTGPGANPQQRVPWSHRLTDDQAENITIQKVLAGPDNWNPTSPEPVAASQPRATTMP